MKSKQIIIIAISFTLSMAFFVFKDDLTNMIPNNNAVYKEKFATYEKTEATILKKEYVKNNRGPSRLCLTIEFTDKEGTEYTYKLYENALEGTKVGDKTIIYYNPQNPESDVESETVYKQIM